jgi:hypothetical protein
MGGSILLSLFLDVIVAGLLSVMIVYCIKLNKRIRVLQDSKSELAQLIQRFDESTQKATVSINEIHKASKKINENIQARLDKANFLADDLAFMIEKGTKLADRMEGDISGARGGASAGARPAAPSNASSAAAELAARQANSAPRRPERGERPERPQRPERAERPESAAPAPAGQRVAGVRMRSKAEQDLLDALKNKA